MMSGQSPVSQRKILSPKPPLRRVSNRFDAIEGEYQLKSAKGNVKIDREKQKGLGKGSQRQSPVRQIKRKLSFKKTMAPDENIQMKVHKQLIITKQPDKLQTNEELRLALQYNQLGQQSREGSKIKQNDREVSPMQLRRLKRIRSNDFYQRKTTKIESLQKDDDSVLLKARRENKNLKILQLRSAKKIQELESQYAQQKIVFAKQEKFLRLKISVLKSKIETNKNQIGHLFSYEAFDQAKLLIKPIVEVDGQSSITRSWMNSSEINELKQISKIYENEINVHDKKELMTEATGPTSRESCGQLDGF